MYCIYYIITKKVSIHLQENVSRAMNFVKHKILGQLEKLKIKETLLQCKKYSRN